MRVSGLSPRGQGAETQGKASHDSSKVVRSGLNQRFFFKFDSQLEEPLCRNKFPSCDLSVLIYGKSPFMKARFTDFLTAKTLLRTKVQGIAEDFTETCRRNHKEKGANRQVSDLNQLK